MSRVGRVVAGSLLARRSGLIPPSGDPADSLSFLVPAAREADAAGVPGANYLAWLAESRAADREMGPLGEDQDLVVEAAAAVLDMSLREIGTAPTGAAVRAFLERQAAFPAEAPWSSPRRAPFPRRSP